MSRHAFPEAGFSNLFLVPAYLKIVCESKIIKPQPYSMNLSKMAIFIHKSNETFYVLLSSVLLIPPHWK